jgi:hypothetical protein
MRHIEISKRNFVMGIDTQDPEDQSLSIYCLQARNPRERVVNSV